MLVIDVSVNRKKLIDTIYINRKEGKMGEVCRYRIVKPEGPWNDIDIYHPYDDGYFDLLVKAVNLMKKYKYKQKKKK